MVNVPAANGIPQLGFGTYPLTGEDCIKAVRMALNQLLSDDDAALNDGAEVAFFPPVTGG